MMHDPSKLPVEMWAEKGDERTRIMIRVNGSFTFELMSWPNNAQIADGKITIRLP